MSLCRYNVGDARVILDLRVAGMLNEDVARVIVDLRVDGAEYVGV